MTDLYIDVGSTNVKYATDDGNVRSKPFPNPSRNDEPYFEVPIEKILSVVKEIIAKEKDAENIWLSVQMHGYVLSDEAHTPLTPYISWRDKRFLTLNEEYPFTIEKSYGTREKPNLAPFGIYTIAKEKQTLFARARYFDTLGSYLYFALTGVFATHLTDACASGFYSLSGNKNALTEQKPFSLLRFPAAETAVCARGTYDGKRVFVPVGDQQASIFGVAPRKNEVVLNTGTAAQLCTVEDGVPLGDFETRPYFSGKTLCTVTGLIGGAVYDQKTEGEICENYASAIEKLPKKEKLVAVGGLAEYHAEAFRRIGKAISNQYELKTNTGAIKGLMNLANKNEAGMMLSEIPFSNMPIILKSSGFDFFIIDCEHGGFDYSDVSKIIMTAKLVGLKCIIRLADNTRKDIIKFMDMGADGLLLQMTNTPKDIQKVVEYAKYAPIGKRGISTMRAHTLYDPPELLGYMQSANERTEIYAQIETVEGAKNVAEIANVEGVAGCLVGPNDLSADFGCLGEKNAPQVLSTIENVANACAKAGKRSGIITGNSTYLSKAKESGMQMFCVGSELNMLKDSACRTVQRIKDL